MSLYDEWAEVYELFYGNIKIDIPFCFEYAQQKGSPILEVACGTGRVLMPLAEAGYEVWGIDFSSGMLAKAQQKIPFRSFLLLLTVEDQTQTLNNIRKDLKMMEF
mgnify:CR=1 FL=1